MATLTEYLKKQINPDEADLAGTAVTPIVKGAATASQALARGASNPATFTGIPQQIMGGIVKGIGTGITRAVSPTVGVAAPAIKPVAPAPNALALTPGEAVVAPTGVRPAVNALGTYTPAEQAAITNDVRNSGLKDFNVEPKVAQPGGVRARVPAAQGVTQTQPAPEQEVPAVDQAAAYKARTGIDINNLPSNQLVTNIGGPLRQAGVTEPVLPSQSDAAQLSEQNKILNAFYASPEGKAFATQEQGGPVEVVRGGVTTFETPGAQSPALTDYLFGQQQKAQLQQDYLSAVSKPVGSTLTLGEAEALKATDRAMQEQGNLGVAGIQEGGRVRAAEIGAAAGKNPLYDLAAQDIAATPAPERTSKLQQYLGTGSKAATVDATLKPFLDQLIDPVEQQTFAALYDAGTPAARAFALAKQSKKK